MSRRPFTRLEVGALYVSTAAILIASAYILSRLFVLYRSSFNISSFLGLFIPGLITVGGSFYIYNRRRRDKRERLRAALRAELVQMHHIEKLPEKWEDAGFDPDGDNKKLDASVVPTSSHISTHVYEANVNSLGELETDEVEAIVEFYTMILYLKDIMDMISGGEDVPSDGHSTLFKQMDAYSEYRSNLVSMIDGETDPAELEFVTEKRSE